MINTLIRKNYSMDYLDKIVKEDFRYKTIKDDGEIAYTNKLQEKIFKREKDEYNN